MNNKPEKKFTMLDEFGCEVVMDAICDADCNYRESGIRSKSTLGCLMYIDYINKLGRLKEKLKEKDEYFIGSLSCIEKSQLGDALVDFKDKLRTSAIDYKIGLETEGNKMAYDKYIVLSKLIDGIKIC